MEQNYIPPWFVSVPVKPHGDILECLMHVTLRVEVSLVRLSQATIDKYTRRSRDNGGYPNILRASTRDLPDSESDVKPLPDLNLLSEESNQDGDKRASCDEEVRAPNPLRRVRKVRSGQAKKSSAPVVQPKTTMSCFPSIGAIVPKVRANDNTNLLTESHHGLHSIKERKTTDRVSGHGDKKQEIPVLSDRNTSNVTLNSVNSKNLDTGSVMQVKAAMNSTTNSYDSYTKISLEEVKAKLKAKFKQTGDQIRVEPCKMTSLLDQWLSVEKHYMDRISSMSTKTPGAAAFNGSTMKPPCPDVVFLDRFINEMYEYSVKVTEKAMNEEHAKALKDYFVGVMKLRQYLQISLEAGNGNRKVASRDHWDYHGAEVSTSSTSNYHESNTTRQNPSASRQRRPSAIGVQDAEINSSEASDTPTNAGPSYISESGVQDPNMLGTNLLPPGFENATGSRNSVSTVLNPSRELTAISTSKQSSHNSPSYGSSVVTSPMFRTAETCNPCESSESSVYASLSATTSVAPYTPEKNYAPWLIELSLVLLKLERDYDVGRSPSEETSGRTPGDRDDYASFEDCLLYKSLHFLQRVIRVFKNVRFEDIPPLFKRVSAENPQENFTESDFTRCLLKVTKFINNINSGAYTDLKTPLDSPLQHRGVLPDYVLTGYVPQRNNTLVNCGNQGPVFHQTINQVNHIYQGDVPQQDIPLVKSGGRTSVSDEPHTQVNGIHQGYGSPKHNAHHLSVTQTNDRVNFVHEISVPHESNAQVDYVREGSVPHEANSQVQFVRRGSVPQQDNTQVEGQHPGSASEQSNVRYIYDQNKLLNNFFTTCTPTSYSQELSLQKKPYTNGNKYLNLIHSSADDPRSGSSDKYLSTGDRPPHSIATTNRNEHAGLPSNVYTGSDSLLLSRATKNVTNCNETRKVSNRSLAKEAPLTDVKSSKVLGYTEDWRRYVSYIIAEQKEKEVRRVYNHLRTASEQRRLLGSHRFMRYRAQFVRATSRNHPYATAVCTQIPRDHPDISVQGTSRNHADATVVQATSRSQTSGGTVFQVTYRRRPQPYLVQPTSAIDPNVRVLKATSRNLKDLGNAHSQLSTGFPGSSERETSMEGGPDIIYVDEAPQQRCVSRDSGYLTPAPKEESLSSIDNKEVDEETILCAECGQRAMVMCSLCHARFYCSEQCQVKHWEEVHQTECSGIVEES